MKRFEWEWHCEWIGEYEDVIERHYADIGDLEKFSDWKLSDYDEAVYMVYGLTLHWNCDGDWTDIEQERAYINEKSELDENVPFSARSGIHVIPNLDAQNGIGVSKSANE